MIMMLADLERGDATGLSGQSHYPWRSGQVMWKANLPDPSLNINIFLEVASVFYLNNSDIDYYEILQWKSIGHSEFLLFVVGRQGTCFTLAHPAYKRIYTNLTYKLKSGLAHAAC